MQLIEFNSVSETQLQKLITALGIVIACQVIYIQHGWINDDTVLYLEAARLFSLGDWKQGVTLFNWPLYSLLISFVHLTTNFNLQTSAQILNVLFFAITTYSFIELIKLAGGNKTTIICGAFLLFSSSYIVGDILPMLLRDQGFWATYLTSLVFFIKYYRHHQIRDAVLWQVCTILAVLFRIEAVTFLVCLPFILFFQTEYSTQHKISHFLKINIVAICSLILIGVVLISSSIHLSDFGRLQEIVTIIPRLFNNLTIAFTDKATIMGREVLGSFLDDYAIHGIIITLISIVVFKTINLISLPVIAVFIFNGFCKKETTPVVPISPDAKKIFYWAALLALINAIIIISSVFVLSTRYIIALGFIILIFAAFNLATLCKLLTKNIPNQSWKQVILIFLLLLIGLFAVKNILPKQDGYNFEQAAVAYLKQQDIPNNKVFYVSPRSRFYAGANYNGRGYDYWEYIQNAVENGTIFKYDYLLLNVSNDPRINKQQILANQLHEYQLVKQFFGYKKKKKIMLYVRKSVLNR